MSASGVFIRLAIVIAALLVAVTARAGTYRFDDADLLGDAALMPDWAATLERQHAQNDNLLRCRADPAECPSYYRGVRVILERAEKLSPSQQIRLVNFFVNKRRYRNDRTTMLPSEVRTEPVRYRSRWTTVEEFLARGGDCEDFATTKYFLLRALGFSADNLRIVVVYDRQARGYHALLAVRRENGKVRLLDSDGAVTYARRSPYRFIYSVNEHSVWDHQPKRKSRIASTTTRKEKSA